MNFKASDIQPAWFVDENAIIDTEARHGWMCEQLLHRRKTQSGGNVVHFYHDVLRSLFQVDDFSELQAMEVLSDGLGYIEPNWHGIKIEQKDVKRIPNSSLELYRSRIATRRQRYRTHRTVGRELYQSALFAISGERVWVLSSQANSEQWQELNRSAMDDLPTKRLRGRPESLGSGDLAEILATIAGEVLWPSFFATDTTQNEQNLSLVLLHTSLWHDAAGVWNLHAHIPHARNITPRQLENTSQFAALRSLVAAPVRCLEDVADWAYAQEGLHRRRRFNVNFGYHCLGQIPPRWSEDGLQGMEADRGRDIQVYNLPPHLPPWVSTPKIVTLATTGRLCTCAYWKPIIMAFTTARLVLEQKGHDLADATSILPSYVDLYAEQLLDYIGHTKNTGGGPVAGDEMVAVAVAALSCIPDCCDLCKSLAENLNLYWEAVKNGTALG